MPICHGALVWPSFASSQTALVRLIFRTNATAGEGKRRAAAGLRILAAQDVNKELNNLWWKWLKVKLSVWEEELRQYNRQTSLYPIQKDWLESQALSCTCMLLIVDFGIKNNHQNKNIVLLYRSYRGICIRLFHSRLKVSCSSFKQLTSGFEASEVNVSKWISVL